MGVTGKPKRPHKFEGFLLDFGPLLIFFVAYKMTGIIFATLIFIAAIVVAMLVSLVRFRWVPPMTWISAILIIGFGGLTIYFHDQRFIQMKPTFIYAGFSLLLFGGLAFRKPLLKFLFGPVFEGLSERGWIKLSLNWAIFFAGMAVINEVLRAFVSFDTWLTLKVWGATGLSLLFGAANVPMLMRHGLTLADAEEEPPVPPPSL